MKNEKNILWTPSDVVVIPSAVQAPSEIVRYGAATLSERDMRSIVAGFEAESYEMVSTFVWTKAAAAMKKQVATLGMEFVGEMLGRPDLNDDSDPMTAVSDHEIITLAEDLGMITSTQALRLKHSFQLVTHFASLDDSIGDEECMLKSEAINLLHTSITSILGKPRFEAAVKFAEFRKGLSERTLKPYDDDVAAIRDSAYFFVRTTLSVLLSLVKGNKSAPVELKGAQLEHAVGNIMILIPVLWGRLKQQEKWQIGQAYAEVNAAGNRLASAGIKKALVDVKGFDFVPETLRSATFTEAAAKVLSAHFAMNNFYNEQAPMQMLANLGTTIPMPAFAKCMEATLAVRLGNRWGMAFNAQEAAKQVLSSLQANHWEYYFNECLHRDRTVLDKLSFEVKPIKEWRAVVSEYIKPDYYPRDKQLKALLDASRLSSNDQQIMGYANLIRSNQG